MVFFLTLSRNPPSSKRLRSLDEISSENRCHVRGKKFKNTARILLETKCSQSQANRNEASFIFEFRRWLIEFWNSVMKRLKNVFSETKHCRNPENSSAKATNVDSENIFWRHGGLRSKPSKFRNLNLQNSRTSVNRSARSRNFSVPKSKQKSSKGLTNFFTTPETTDDDYFALYKKSSRRLSFEKSSAISSRSSEVETESIEKILARYRPRDPATFLTNSDFDTSIENLQISEEKNIERSRIIEMKMTRKKSIENSSFESKLFSKSDLNLAPNKKNFNRRKNQISRIPRPRNFPQTRSSQIYRSKIHLRPAHDYH